MKTLETLSALYSANIAGNISRAREYRLQLVSDSIAMQQELAGMDGRKRHAIEVMQNRISQAKLAIEQIEKKIHQMDSIDARIEELAEIDAQVSELCRQRDAITGGPLGHCYAKGEAYSF